MSCVNLNCSLAYQEDCLDISYNRCFLICLDRHSWMIGSCIVMKQYKMPILDGYDRVFKVRSDCIDQIPADA